MISAEVCRMLEVTCHATIADVEILLRRAVQRHGAVLHTVTHLGHVLSRIDNPAVKDAYVYTICQADLYAPLLEADVRFAAFLPLSVAAWTKGEGSVTLQALSPLEICRILDRPSLEDLVKPVENLLIDIMADAGEAVPAVPHAAARPKHSTEGATEDQVSMRAAIPQRIDRRGSKVEELAGIGVHDGSGG